MHDITDWYATELNMEARSKSNADAIVVAMDFFFFSVQVSQHYFAITCIGIVWYVVVLYCDAGYKSCVESMQIHSLTSIVLYCETVHWSVQELFADANTCTQRCCNWCSAPSSVPDLVQTWIYMIYECNSIKYSCMHGGAYLILREST